VFDVNLVGSADWKRALDELQQHCSHLVDTARSAGSDNDARALVSARLDQSVVQSRVAGLLSVAIRGRTPDVFIFNSRESGAALVLAAR
jgi:hypothetical protein